MLDLCGLQGDEGGVGEPMGGWSLTVALCTMVVQARAGWQRAQRRDMERERKRFSDLEREKDVKRERGQWKRGKQPNGGEPSKGERGLRASVGSYSTIGDEEIIKGVRRRMEMERKQETSVTGVGGSRKETEDVNSEVLVHVRADLFVNARSWERVHVALSTPGPLKLQCRYLRVEEISVSSIRTLLDLLPQQGLLGIDVRYSNLGVAGLAELLPLLSNFPALKSLRLHYCNLDFRRDHPGQEEALQALSRGLANLQGLRRLSLTALRLPGQLRVLLRYGPITPFLLNFKPHESSKINTSIIYKHLYVFFSITAHCLSR